LNLLLRLTFSILGQSFLYTSLKLQNPGPLSDDSDVSKSTQEASPRTISVQLPGSQKSNVRPYLTVLIFFEA